MRFLLIIATPLLCAVTREEVLQEAALVHANHLRLKEILPTVEEALHEEIYRPKYISKLVKGGYSTPDKSKENQLRALVKTTKEDIDEAAQAEQDEIQAVHAFLLGEWADKKTAIAAAQSNLEIVTSLGDQEQISKLSAYLNDARTAELTFKKDLLDTLPEYLHVKELIEYFQYQNFLALQGHHARLSAIVAKKKEGKRRNLANQELWKRNTRIFNWALLGVCLAGAAYIGGFGM